MLSAVIDARRTRRASIMVACAVTLLPLAVAEAGDLPARPRIPRIDDARAARMYVLVGRLNDAVGERTYGAARQRRQDLAAAVSAGDALMLSALGDAIVGLDRRYRSAGERGAHRERARHDACQSHLVNVLTRVPGCASQVEEICARPDVSARLRRELLSALLHSVDSGQVQVSPEQMAGLYARAACHGDHRVLMIGLRALAGSAEGGYECRPPLDRATAVALLRVLAEDRSESFVDREPYLRVLCTIGEARESYFAEYLHAVADYSRSPHARRVYIHNLRHWRRLSGKQAAMLDWMLAGDVEWLRSPTTTALRALSGHASAHDNQRDESAAAKIESPP